MLAKIQPQAYMASKALDVANARLWTCCQTFEAMCLHGCQTL